MPNASSIYFTVFLACQNHICANDGNKYLTLDTHNLSTTKTNDGKSWMYFVCVCVLLIIIYNLLFRMRESQLYVAIHVVTHFHGRPLDIKCHHFI